MNNIVLDSIMDDIVDILNVKEDNYGYTMFRDKLETRLDAVYQEVREAVKQQAIDAVKRIGA
jgi:hypothetical protein